MTDLAHQELVGACYSRVSTEQLASTEHGSLEQQRHLCDEWAAYLSNKTSINHKIKFYLEDAAMSGATEDRPGYQQLKLLIKERKIRFVIFKELSRATRDLRELLNFIALAQANKVDIHIRGMPDINLSSPTGTVMVHLMGSLGQYERSLCIQRVKENIRSSARNNGKINGGPVVLGFDRNPSKKGFWIPNESEINQVNYIMKTYLETGSLKITSDECKRFGIKNKTGIALTPKSVRSILTNHKYVGKIKVFIGVAEDKFEWVDVPHGVVVDQSLFERVQQKLNVEDGKTKFTHIIKKKVYLLTGVLFYFKDGSTFAGQSCTNGSGQRLEYYWNAKHKVRLWATDFESAVFNSLIGCLSKNEELAKLVASLKNYKDSKTQTLEEQIRSLKKEIKNLEEQEISIFDKMKSTLNLSVTLIEWLDQQVRKIKDQRSDLNYKLQDATQELEKIKKCKTDLKPYKNQLIDVLKKIREGDPVRARNFLRQILERVIVFDDNRVEIKWRVSKVLDTESHCLFTAEENPAGKDKWLRWQDSNLRPSD